MNSRRGGTSFPSRYATVLIDSRPSLGDTGHESSSKALRGSPDRRRDRDTYLTNEQIDESRTSLKQLMDQFCADQ